MRKQPSGRPGRGLLVLLVVVLTMLMPRTAAASAPVNTFLTIESKPVGCSGAVITSITEEDGARYYYRGKRLRFPTAVLPFNRFGVVEISAKPTRGNTVSAARGELRAPSECFTDVRVGVEPRYEAKQSWCTSDESPVLQQVFDTQALEMVAEWRLLRRSTHESVAHGRVKLYLGTMPVAFTIPAGLPRGRYVFTVRDVDSSPTLYPYSLAVEHYRCLKEPWVRKGEAKFRVPRSGPGVDLHLTDASSPVETVVHVRAGRSYTVRTTSPELHWVAYAHGNHVGNLGFGQLQIPQ